MKHILTIFLSAMIIFFFSACTSRDIESETVSSSAAPVTTAIASAIKQPSQEKLIKAFEEVKIENWDGNYKNLTFEQRTALEQYFARQWSEDVKFSDEGVIYVENTVPLKGSWADNAILNHVPEPDFGNIFTSSVEQKTVSVSFTNVTAEALKIYTDECKAAGFDNVLEEYASSCCGTVFKSANKDGVTVSLSSKFITQAVTTIVVSVAGDANVNPSEYKKITPEEAKALIDAGDVIILDVRTQEEYDTGHIRDAVLLPDTNIADIAATVLPDKNSKILVYCRSGRRSAGAAKELIKMGYTDILDFGGINDWPYEIIN